VIFHQSPEIDDGSDVRVNRMFNSAARRLQRWSRAPSEDGREPDVSRSPRDQSEPRQRTRQRSRDTTDFGNGSEWWSLEQQPVAYYRAAAERARRLQAEATTPRLKQYLGEVIEQSERLAEEVERASEKD
jgi:hypothetical protein